jgi:hypothetical protein
MWIPGSCSKDTDAAAISIQRGKRNCAGAKHLRPGQYISAGIK